MTLFGAGLSCHSGKVRQILLSVAFNGLCPRICRQGIRIQFKLKNTGGRLTENIFKSLYLFK
jgi:hypothetical protein